MAEFLPFKEVYNRIYPKHLRSIKSADHKNFQDLCGHMDDLEGIVAHMHQSICSSFHGEAQKSELRKLYANVLEIADGFLAEGSKGFFYLSMQAIELAGVFMDAQEDHKEFFKLHGEHVKALFEEYEKQKKLAIDELNEATETKVAHDINHFDVMETASDKLADFVVRSTATLFENAARIPLLIPQGKELRQKAIHHLVDAAEYDIERYQEILYLNYDTFSEPDNYPGTREILEKSYDAILADAERNIESVLQQNTGDEEAYYIVVSSLFRFAGWVIADLQMPSMETRALSALRSHWKAMTALDEKSAAADLKEYQNDLKQRLDEEGEEPGILTLLDELDNLDEEPVITIEKCFIAPPDGDAERIHIVNKFAAWQPDAYTPLN